MMAMSLFFQWKPGWEIAGNPILAVNWPNGAEKVHVVLQYAPHDLFFDPLDRVEKVEKGKPK